MPTELRKKEFQMTQFLQLFETETALDVGYCIYGSPSSWVERDIKPTKKNFKNGSL
jgi:hypothetical protein